MKATLGRLPVAVDAMGGDGAPLINIEGAIQAVNLDGQRSILVGRENQLYQMITHAKATHLLDNGLLFLHNADEIVYMDDKPAAAARKKKKSSMHVACELVKTNKASVVLSAGNSGAMMAISLLLLGRIKGVLRPAIVAIMPSKLGLTVVLDVGANTECLPEYLFQFALMGHVYASVSLGVKSPRIGVLANGSEDSKGTEMTRASLALLRQADLDVVGHCEGRDIFNGNVNVVVCDGFSGNLVLKTAEGTASFLMNQIKESFQNAKILGKIGGLLSRPVFQVIKANLDPREFGAAPLLGLNEICYIAHGSADAYTMRKAIVRAGEQAEQQLSGQIASLINRYEHLAN